MLTNNSLRTKGRHNKAISTYAEFNRKEQETDFVPFTNQPLLPRCPV